MPEVTRSQCDHCERTDQTSRYTVTAGDGRSHLVMLCPDHKQQMETLLETASPAPGSRKAPQKRITDDYLSGLHRT